MKDWKCEHERKVFCKLTIKDGATGYIFSQGMGERDSVGQFVRLYFRGSSVWQSEGRESGGRGFTTP